MFELGEVRDGQPQVLAVVGGPVLMYFLLIEVLRSREDRVVTQKAEKSVWRQGDRFALVGKVCVAWRWCNVMTRGCGAPFSMSRPEAAVCRSHARGCEGTSRV